MLFLMVLMGLIVVFIPRPPKGCLLVGFYVAKNQPKSIPLGVLIERMCWKGGKWEKTRFCFLRFFGEKTLRTGFFGGEGFFLLGEPEESETCHGLYIAGSCASKGGLWGRCFR